MIRRGTHITADVQGDAVGLLSFHPWDASDEGYIRSQVKASLLPYMQVFSVNLTSSNFDPGKWTYQATVDGVILADYNDIDDVAGIIGHAFYTATGYMPSVSVPFAGDYTGQPQQEPVLPGFDWGELGKNIQSSLVVIALGAVAIYLAMKP